MQKVGSKEAMLLGSCKIYWQILSENNIFTYKNTFGSKKSCQNKSCAAKVLAGILSNSATGSFGTFSIPSEKTSKSDAKDKQEAYFN